MYNNAKKNSFLTEVKTLAQDVSSKYITESMKGNKLTTISNKQNSLDLSGRNIEYSFDLDEKGKIKKMMVYDGTYCVTTTKDYTNLKTSDVSDKCSYDELHNIVGTLSKDFYEKSGKTDRGLVNSITFYSDGKTIAGAESYDVSEKGDNSIIMYVEQNSEDSSLLDLTLVANGIIAFPEDSSKLFSFYGAVSCGVSSSLSSILFNNSIDTSNVNNMSYMFLWSGCDYGRDKNCEIPILGTLDLSIFNTSNVTNMSGMLSANGATEIKGLNKFDTSKVTNMNSMFNYSQATSLDLSSFDTSSVTDIGGMFSSSTSLKTIYTSDKFIINDSASADGIFAGCTSLVGGAGTVFDSTKTDKTYARIDGGTSNPGYFTRK